MTWEKNMVPALSTQPWKNLFDMPLFGQSRSVDTSLPASLWWCFPASVFSNHQVHYSCKRVHCFVKSRSRVNIDFPTAVLTTNIISRETFSKKWWEEEADWSAEGPFLLWDQDELLFSCNCESMLKPWLREEGLNSDGLMSLTLAIRPLFTYKISTTTGNGFTSKLQAAKEFCHVWNRSGFISQNPPIFFLFNNGGCGSITGQVFGAQARRSEFDSTFM